MRKDIKMVLANDLLSSSLAQGVIKFINDFQGVLMAVEAVIAVALIIWQCIRMQAATSSFDDGGSGTPTKKYIDNIKKIIITGVCIVAATYMVPLIFGYFNGGGSTQASAYIVHTFTRI